MRRSRSDAACCCAGADQPCRTLAAPLPPPPAGVRAAGRLTLMVLHLLPHCGQLGDRRLPPPTGFGAARHPIPAGDLTRSDCSPGCSSAATWIRTSWPAAWTPHRQIQGGPRAARAAGRPAAHSCRPLLPVRVTARLGQTPPILPSASLALATCVWALLSFISSGASSRAPAGAGLRARETRIATGRSSGQTGRCILAMLRRQGRALSDLTTLGARVHLSILGARLPLCKGHVLPTFSTRGGRYPPTVY